MRRSKLPDTLMILGAMLMAFGIIYLPYAFAQAFGEVIPAKE